MSAANQKPAASSHSDCRTGPQLKAFVKEGPSAQTSIWPSNVTSWLTRFRRRRTPASARFFSDDR